MIQGFLVALVAALVYMESRIGGQHMLDRPIIIGPLVGDRFKFCVNVKN